jgi:hypothetical protein
VRLFNKAKVGFILFERKVTAMAQAPGWLQHLDEEDHHFIKRLVLASGSLKDLAEEYGVSYPTIRLRLDRLIERIRTLDDHEPADGFHAKIRLLVADGEMSAKLGKELLQLHKSTNAHKGGGWRLCSGSRSASRFPRSGARIARPNYGR